MSEPPRAPKRVKKSEEEGAEQEIFSSPELLKYQNKALASFLQTERTENTNNKRKVAKLESKNSELISITSLLYHQLLIVNDKLNKSLSEESEASASNSNLRENTSVMDNYNLIVSADSDKILEASEQLKDCVKTIGATVSSTVDLLTTSLIKGDTNTPDLGKLRDELTKANTQVENMQSLQVEYDSKINNLKQTISELQTKAAEDEAKMKVLKLRGDRYLPYIKFESKNFQVQIPPHTCICHTCSKEMKIDAAAIENFNRQTTDGNMDIDEETKNDPQYNAQSADISDTDAEIRALKKVNSALFEIISELKTKEFTMDQEIINSRPFNRLLRNGHQLLQAHDELMKNYNELKTKLDQVEEAKSKAIEELKEQHNKRLTEFSAQLQGVETQLKFTEIEKENLKKEIDRKSNVDIDALEKSISDLRQETRTLEEDNKKLKDDLSKILKEKSTLSDRLNTLRLEYDEHLNSGIKKSSTDKDVLIDNQSKQIKDLIEELNNEKAQITETYTEMEAIYQANQDLEAKNKICLSKVEDANKRLEKVMEESFKRSRINENSKKEVIQMENQLKIKEEIIEKQKEERKILNDLITNEKQLSHSYKDQLAEKDQSIKQLETEISEMKKKNSELKQRVEQADTVITQAHEEISERLFKMAVNYVKTGTIQDPKTTVLDDGNFKNLNETDILMLELRKYKQMVKCPTCNDKDRCIRLKCKHTYCQTCVEENMASRARKCPQCREKISGGDLIEFTLN